MQISEKGIKFICGFEGFRTFPYQDVKGVWTIGYGTTLYPNGLRVSATDMAVTEKLALDCLKYHVDSRIAQSLNGLIAECNLSQNQVDALCSFIYNVGAHAFNESTLLKDIKKWLNSSMAQSDNVEFDEAIRTDFLMWVKSGGRVVDGLVKRRKAEAELFLNGLIA
jgi:lysozyme